MQQSLKLCFFLSHSIDDLVGSPASQKTRRVAGVRFEPARPAACDAVAESEEPRPAKRRRRLPFSPMKISIYSVFKKWTRRTISSGSLR